MTASIRLKPLLVSLAIPLAGGFISNWLSGDVKSVYESLRLPGFAPPAWLFAPAWTVLYLMMGLAAYLVWQRPDSDSRTQALTFYGVQLALNLLWSPLFFRFGMYRAAFWLLCAIFLLALVTAVCFWHLDRAAGLLLVPYLLWLLYASALNRAIVSLN